MFICKECLKDDQKWKADIMPSFGECEICGDRTACADVSYRCSKEYEGDDD